MQYLRRIAFNLILVLFLVGCAVQTSLQTIPQTAPNSAVVSLDPGWKVAFQEGIAQPLRYAAFLDESFGLTGGPSEAGRAHYTTDGGKTWTMAETSTDCVFNLDIVDTLIAWQCSLGPVRRSLDGGRTWQPVMDYGNYCRQLSFLDARTGWLAGVDSVAMTVDGGASWQALELPAAAVRFFDAQNGLVVLHKIDASHSHLISLRTSDGGASWSQQILMDVPLLLGLYLSRDGATLTLVDHLQAQITVLRSTGAR